MKDILATLKEAVITKAEIAKEEAILWQKLSKALDILIRNEQKPKSEQRPPHITLVQQASSSRYLTMRQASQYLGISKSTLYEMRKSGLLKYVKAGKRMARYRIEDLDALTINSDISTNPEALHKN